MTTSPPRVPWSLCAAALLAVPVFAVVQRGSTPAPAAGRGATPETQRPAATDGKGGASTSGSSTPSSGSERGAQDGPKSGSKDAPGSTKDAPAKGGTVAEVYGDRAEEYFAIADYNGDGSINFNEARQSLGVDRNGFAVFDKDNNGLIDLEEFKLRYEGVIARGGAFTPPTKKPEVRKPPRREAAELLETYGQSVDVGLDIREVQRALSDYLVLDPSPEKIFESLDRDSSKKLELVELGALADILSPKPVEDETAKPKPKTILELFGQLVPREEREGATHLPPQIPGPVPVFRRLDLNGDGMIELDDLSELQRPIQVSVRVNAVFAVLDTNGDGRISEEELHASMRTKRP